MGFRFQKRIKIAPGVRLNLSKSGVSVSSGIRGATVNFSRRGTRATLGLPGTGLSYSTKIGSKRRSKRGKATTEKQVSKVRRADVKAKAKQIANARKQSEARVREHESSIQTLLGGWRNQLVHVDRDSYVAAAAIRPFKSSNPPPKKLSASQIKTGLRRVLEKEILLHNPVPFVFYLVAGTVSLVFAVLLCLLLSGFFALVLFCLLYTSPSPRD